MIWPEDGIEDVEKKKRRLRLTDDLGKGVGEDGKWKAEKYSKVFTVRFLRAMAKAIPDFPFNILVTEANFLRFRQKTSKPWPAPHPGPVLEEHLPVLAHREAQGHRARRHLPPLSSPARHVQGQGRQAGVRRSEGLRLRGGGGLYKVAEPGRRADPRRGLRPPAQARFFKAFWEPGSGPRRHLQSQEPHYRSARK